MRIGTRTSVGLRAALIVAAGAWAYAPAIHGGWLWDDPVEVALNPMLRSADGLRRIWLTTEALDYFPLKSTVEWAQWHAWGDRVAGYHLTSLALHLLAALLLWRLLSKFGVSAAWVGGLIFAVHPVAVESVAWISELKNTLSLPPLLLAMGAWVDFESGAGIVVAGVADPGRPASTRPATVDPGGRPQRGRLQGDPGYSRGRIPFLSLFWFAVAMLCKSSVALFPAVLLLFAWWKRGSVDRRDAAAIAPFCAVSLALGLTTVWFQMHRAIGGFHAEAVGLGARAAAAGLSLVFYLSKGVCPAAVTAIYPRWDVAHPSWASGLPWLAIAAGASWLWSRRAAAGRGALFGFGCFAINLVPVLGFIPMAYERVSWVADHLAYLPLACLAGLAVGAVSYGDERGHDAEIAARSNFRVMTPFINLTPWLAALAIAAMTLESRVYAAAFRDPEAFWTRVVDHNPDASLGWNNLGTIHQESGRMSVAAAEFERALQIDPDYADARYNLALIFADEGRTTEAIAGLDEALRLKPDFPEAHEKLGGEYFLQGRLPEAIDEYRAAARLRPDVAENRANLGSALASAGRLPEAIDEFEAALRLDPAYAEAHCNLGVALAEEGRFSDARVEFETALRARPGYEEAAEYLRRIEGSPDIGEGLK